ncbi:MAG TPA: D-2-hydroxyacid dehydrogenase [Syntrophorhabdales bacterium]|nr:D-2-hydroxyacid dehydrogenase [Syntrophorhabdales bacterium]
MNVLVLDKLAEGYKEAISEKFPDLVIHAATSEKEVGEFIAQADVLLCSRISDGLMQKASKLQWIQAVTTGTDYITRLPSLKKSVIITTTRGIHAPQVSEMVILLMLALNRDLAQVVRNQDKALWVSRPSKLLWKKKAGILGIGVIGEEVARKCKAFGMEVFGMDVVKRNVEWVDHFYGPEDIVEVAGQVDFLILVAPYTPETENIVGPKVVAAMKPTAFLINLARGELIDDEALISALKAGKIAGAGLDVYRQEPLPSDHPFWGMKNVMVIPHMGGPSDVYVEQAMAVIGENLRRYLSGERKNLINLIER